MHAMKRRLPSQKQGNTETNTPEALLKPKMSKENFVSGTRNQINAFVSSSQAGTNCNMERMGLGGRLTHVAHGQTHLKEVPGSQELAELFFIKDGRNG
ncbi:hypothetical protein WR25_05257 [Diploscapter pachys]|uniref:Uncharacterized protein n=1 Tax=Diploscapter pachys TaxID=2018661 RepID=A0A2A2LSV4_9BILA|nr:hypothetical protein WR25_05257 [Diploscapter pachys]